MCLIENKEWPSHCGIGMWRQVFCSMSSLLSHLIRYRLTAGEKQAVPSAKPLARQNFFAPSSFSAASSSSFFRKFRRSSVCTENTHSAPCRYPNVANIEIEWHFTPLCLQRIKPLWEESAFIFFLFSKESLLVKHPLLCCTDIECPKISLFFFFLLQTTVGLFQVCLTYF